MLRVNASLIIVGVGFFYLLSVLSSILIPLVMALLLVFVCYPGIVWLGRRGVPTPIIVPVVIVGSVFVIFLISNALLASLWGVLQQRDLLVSQLSDKMSGLLRVLSESVGVEFDTPEVFRSIFNDQSIRGGLANIATALARGLATFARSFFMFLLYFIFLLFGSIRYESYLSYVEGDNKGLADRIQEIQNTVSIYIRIKTITSLVTGVLVWLVCVFFEVQFPILWGGISFFLNFVPTIGSIVSSLFPFLMSVVQNFGWRQQLILLAALLAIHQTIGSIIEPRVMGSSLRLNAVTVLFGLVFWGYLWGVAGMLLSVPLMVIVKIVLERTPSLEVFARVMGRPDRT